MVCLSSQSSLWSDWMPLKVNTIINHVNRHLFYMQDRPAVKYSNLPSPYHTAVLLRHVSQRVGLIFIPGCLSGCLSVCHLTSYSLPRLIDHNQIWYAGTYRSSHRVSLYGSPVSHTLGSRWKNMENFAYFQL